ncbi:putative ATP-dependent RNA helicase RhlE [Phaeobacter gallaeciensis]|uniref:ATP-dependent RNA helicase RhlE n=1 Tax=Phaeobacter gallaeciensis TaxID=60890 RepID=A0AAC9ZA60_9RHOB|nr:Superfamily II DNA and RNA helicase [Phaeobacter gallaeciensis DSM 26640]ATE93358.1 putative ATP-dependent RNA helicase RhlE [Phaeobacter gallaeciensis]ATE96821.1 putative ATP-dependent RNA helicase RhlE [Phaeobacter gallaeciensis]ATF02022.1 putative ATP-dependent RNA helicase RhlE [Phaeobacter gallaeciensis]ATF06402.1 putative ATP-dependent RNA helicase RhlE [Phaeobacter gallaeciensis]
MGGTGRGIRPAVKGRDVTEFSTMGLPEKLLTRIAELGYTDPTPIQARAIPHALNGKDVLGLAQTGTGKTAAFGVPLIAQMMQYGRKPAAKTVRGLVLAPTRELANQIAANLKGLTEGTPIKTGLVVGGVSINPQISRLSRGTDILIATPGRLLDILDRGALDLGSCDFLVLDEADQMLDLGFIHALRKIAALLPEQRQTMLFSATMPKQMNEIANSYLQSPVRIEVNPPGKAADKITQSVHFIAKAEKLSLLKELLGAHKDERTLVFGRTKHGMEKLMKTLSAAGFSVAAIHGNKSQGQRERALASFKSGEVKILVATDVAARGLDIPDVKYVYNYELPNVPDAYVHRIGRTARAGKDGQAVAFCAPDEMVELKAIQKTMNLNIPVASGRPWEVLPDAKAPTGRRGGGKPGGGKPGGHRRRRSGGGGQGGARSGGQGAGQGGGQGKPGGQRRRAQ